MASDTTQGTLEAAPAAETPFPHNPGVPRSAHGGLPAESAAGSAVRWAGAGRGGARLLPGFGFCLGSDRVGSDVAAGFTPVPYAPPG